MEQLVSTKLTETLQSLVLWFSRLQHGTPSHADFSAIAPCFSDFQDPAQFSEARALGLYENHGKIIDGWSLSPAFLACVFLELPGFSASSAFSLSALKEIIFKTTNVWPFCGFGWSDQVGIDDQDIANVCRLHSTRRKVLHKTAKNLAIAHILAARGSLLFRNESPRFSYDAPAEFRLRDGVTLDVEETVNEIIGVPLPIQGADIVFSGGIKSSVSGGVVVSLSGPAGSGKTSICISLAAAMAPIGTRTVYISFEEREVDLTAKLAFQISDYVNWLGCTRGNLREWFAVRERNITSVSDLQADIDFLTTALSGDPVRKGVSPRYLVVIDSLPAVAEQDKNLDRRVLNSLVVACRELGALVVLISSADNQYLATLDYLVDIDMRVRSEGMESVEVKPTRVLILRKARQQSCRIGTHLFHLSRRQFRLVPQLPAYEERFRRGGYLSEQRGVVIDIFAREFRGNTLKKRAAAPVIATNTRILIDGQGSSGKAGMALKIAMAPRFNVQSNGAFEIAGDPGKLRVLVISFLYPRGYYVELRRKIFGAMSIEYPELGDFVRPSDTSGLDVINFVPGFLSAEDIFYKLVRQIEAAQAEGWPHSAVVIDGLHNLALQFPGARDSDRLWPMVYGYLARQLLTTITTFTSLEYSTRGDPTIASLSADMVDDQRFWLRGHMGLLNLLVHGTDYQIEVERVLGRTGYVMQTRYLARFKSAIASDPTSEVWIWSRTKCRFLHRDATDSSDERQYSLFEGDYSTRAEDS